MRSQAGQNVIAAVHASAAATRAEVNARFAEMMAETRALRSRIDTLQRVVWPLVLLVVSTGFGVLYRFLIDN